MNSAKVEQKPEFSPENLALKNRIAPAETQQNRSNPESFSWYKLTEDLIKIKEGRLDELKVNYNEESLTFKIDNCVPVSFSAKWHLPIDYKALSGAGSTNAGYLAVINDKGQVIMLRDISDEVQTNRSSGVSRNINYQSIQQLPTSEKATAIVCNKIAVVGLASGAIEVFYQDEITEKENSKFLLNKNLKSHSKPIIAIELNKEENEFVSIDESGLIVHWKDTIDSDILNFQKVQEFRTRKIEAFRGMTSTPSLSYIAIIGRKGGCAIFKINSKDEFIEVDCPEVDDAHEINTLAISDNGHYIAFGTQSDKLIIWEYNSSKYEFEEVQNVKNHGGGVTGMQFGNQDNMLYTCSDNGRIILWIKSDSKEETYFDEFMTFVDDQSLSFTKVGISLNDGIVFALDSKTGAIYGYCIQLGEALSEKSRYFLREKIFDEIHYIKGLEMAKSHDLLLMGVEMKDKTTAIKLLTFDQENYSFLEKQSIQGDTTNSQTLHISRDGKYVASGDSNGNITVWGVSKDKQLSHIQVLESNGKGAITSLNISKLAHYIISGTDTGEMSVFQRRDSENNFRRVSSIKASRLELTALDILEFDDREELFLFSGSKSGALKAYMRVIDKSTKEITFKLVTAYHGISRAIRCIEVSDDGQSVAIGSDDNFLRMLMLNNKQKEYIEVQRIKDHTDDISSIDFANFGQVMITGCADGIIRVYMRKQETGYYDFFTKIELEFENLQVVFVSNDGQVLVCCEENSNKVYTLGLKPVDVDHSASSIILLQLINRLADNIGDRVEIERNVIRDMITYLKGSSAENDDFIHSQVNILMAAVCTGNPKLVSRALDYFGYKEYLYRAGHDPLKYVLKSNNGVLLDCFANYMMEHDVPFTMNEKLLLTALASESDDFKLYAVKKCIVPGISLEPERLSDDYYGSEKFLRVVKNNYFHRDDLYRKSLEEQSNFLNKMYAEKVKVKYISTAFPMNPWVGSDFMVQLTKLLSDCHSEVTLSDIKHFVRYSWKQSRYFLYFYAFYYTVFTVVFYIHMMYARNSQYAKEAFAAFKDNPNAVVQSMNYTPFVLVVPIIIYEGLVLSKVGFSYFKGVYNMLDALIIIGLFPVMAISNDNSDVDTDPIWNTIFNVYILLMGTRCLLHLRVIDGVRYLIGMLLQAIYDIRYYSIVFYSFMILFAVSDIYVGHLYDSFSTSFPRVFVGFHTLIAAGGGDWPDRDGYPQIDTMYFLLTNLLISLIMANILIAIISSTYEEFQENKELKDIEELLDMVYEFGCFMSRIKCMIGGQGKASYIHFMVPLKENVGNTISANSRYGRSNGKY